MEKKTEALSALLADLSKKTLAALDLVVLIEKIEGDEESTVGAARNAYRSFYNELGSLGYERSWANPAYCSDLFPPDLSSLLCTIYYGSFQLPGLYATGRREEFNGFIELVSNLVLKRKELDLQNDIDRAFPEFYQLYREYKKATLSATVEADLLKIFGGEHAPLEKAYMRFGTPSLAGLFQYGMDVDPLDESYFLFLSGEMNALEAQADIFVKSFKEGLLRNGTKAGSRNYIRLEYTLGQEPFMHIVRKKLAQEGYVGYAAGVSHIPENRQVSFDHKFDEALVFDEEMVELHLKAYEELMDKHVALHRRYLGIMFLESFGETPFSPASKPANLKMSPKQNELKQKLANSRMMIREKHVPSEETSFCILGLPTSHTGERLRDVFHATCKINDMKNEDYEPVQQLVVNAADQGEYILIRGCGKNETDIRVALPALENPKEQSNFVNCVAEVNVPIGEIFTSPQLRGTHGLLHLPDIYLDGFQYFNLKLHFKDGMIDDYSCTNFPSMEENRAFVKENLLYPHDTLPLGEFAIGTNTLAYVLSQKLEITRILPVLIVEKMGPHFAIGDTCFSHVEDVPFYNFLDNKEVTARDNEFSLKRHQDPEAGYTSVHTDITIPYDEIGLIAAITDQGDMIKIIENGRFVLEGTELLNEPFLEAENLPIPPRPATPTFTKIVQTPKPAPPAVPPMPEAEAGTEVEVVAAVEPVTEIESTTEIEVVTEIEPVAAEAEVAAEVDSMPEIEIDSEIEISLDAETVAESETLAEVESMTEAEPLAAKVEDVTRDELENKPAPMETIEWPKKTTEAAPGFTVPDAFFQVPPPATPNYRIPSELDFSIKSTAPITPVEKPVGPRPSFIAEDFFERNPQPGSPPDTPPVTPTVTTPVPPPVPPPASSVAAVPEQFTPAPDPREFVDLKLDMMKEKESISKTSAEQVSREAAKAELLKMLKKNQK